MQTKVFIQNFCFPSWLSTVASLLHPTECRLHIYFLGSWAADVAKFLSISLKAMTAWNLYMPLYSEFLYIFCGMCSRNACCDHQTKLKKQSTTKHLVSFVPQVFPMTSSGAPISEYPFIRTGLLGFIGPGGLVFVVGKMDGLMVVSGRRHNADDIVATALAVEPMKFVYRGRFAFVIVF